MAFRSTGVWTRTPTSLRGKNTNTFATSTPRRTMTSYSPAADQFANPIKEGSTRKASWWPPRGDYVPVYVALGFIVLSASMGVHTIVHQMFYSPSVRVKKKLRETVPEVVEPEKVVDESQKFLGNSWFRKLAHVQEFKSGIQTLPYPETTDVYSQPVRAVTLKSVGVDPKGP